MSEQNIYRTKLYVDASRPRLILIVHGKHVPTMNRGTSIIKQPYYAELASMNRRILTNR